MKILKKSLSVLLICALLICGIQFTATAGAAIAVVDGSSYADELQGAKWHNSNEDVIVENSKIVFPKDSTADTKLICKTVAEVSSVYNELVSAEATVNIKKLSSGQTFNMGFALDSIEAMIGDMGNIEIEFTNKGGIYAALNIYDSDGNLKTVKSQKVGSLNSDIKISAMFTVDNKMTLSVGGKSFCTKLDTKVDCTGRIGFMQSDTAHVVIDGILFKYYNYSLPENTDIFEDFNDGEFNLNFFTSGVNYSSAHPAGIYVGEYKGEGALIVENSRVGYFSTKLKYSNFEMQYDVLFSQNYKRYNDDGSTYTHATDYHIIRFGSEYSEVEGWGGDSTGHRLNVGANAGMIYSNGEESTFKSSKEHIINAAENSERGFTVKLRMVDGVFTSWVKWLDEKEFTQMVVADDSDIPTPTGFIQFIFDGGDNIVIDNIKITNLDKNANKVDVAYKSNKLPTPEDFDDYVPSEVVYKDLSVKDSASGFNFYLITAIVAAVCVVSIGGTALVLFVLKKKRLKKAAAVEVEAVATTENTAEQEEKADE